LREEVGVLCVKSPVEGGQLLVGGSLGGGVGEEEGVGLVGGDLGGVVDEPLVAEELVLSDDAADQRLVADVCLPDYRKGVVAGYALA
jgi:hypothetical protein